ncbi:MAG: patatin-like phospholipase family protein, partial [Sphingomonadales bacterium]
EMVHEWSAAMVMAVGVPGFFSPRMLPPTMAFPGTPEALSFYDSAPLRDTLDKLVDWDLLNTGPVRLSVGAVDIASGNFRYFDTEDERLKLRQDRQMVCKLLDRLPPELANDPEVLALRARVSEYPVSLVQLIYRANAWEGGSRDFEFSQRSMHEHWQAGRLAVAETMANARIVAANILDGKTAAFDLTHR